MSVTILYPDSKVPLSDKFKMAWEKLRADAPIEERAHAFCWLTYRAFESKVSMEDWKIHVKPNRPTTLSPRWESSMDAAHGFLLANFGELDGAMHFLSDAINKSSCATSIKASVTCAHIAWLKGEDVEKWARSTLNLWKKIVAEVDLFKKPSWVTDSGYDLAPIHCLMRLASNIGLTDVKIVKAYWSDHLIKDDLNRPWLHCCNAMLARKPTCREDIAFMVPTNGSFVELGVARGEFAKRVLERRNVGSYWGIDKWNDERHGEGEFHHVLTTLTDKRASILRCSFEEALARTVIQCQQFDVVYVDGYAHTGQDDGKTLDLWWPKVKDGGVFAGHDYDAAYPLTVKAVDDFAAKNGLVVNTICEKPFNSWWVRKLVGSLA